MARVGDIRSGGVSSKRDVRLWVRGCEPELSFYDQAVSRASFRKRQAETWEEWSESLAEVRSCKRRRLAWLRSEDFAWWDDKAQQAQDKADQGDAFGVFCHF